MKSAKHAIKPILGNVDIFDINVDILVDTRIFVVVEDLLNSRSFTHQIANTEYIMSSSSNHFCMVNKMELLSHFP